MPWARCGACSSPSFRPPPLMTAIAMFLLRPYKAIQHPTRVYTITLTNICIFYLRRTSLFCSELDLQDDFCDCLDSSDEHVTSACAHFWLLLPHLCVQEIVSRRCGVSGLCIDPAAWLLQFSPHLCVGSWFFTPAPLTLTRPLTHLRLSHSHLSPSPFIPHTHPSHTPLRITVMSCHVISRPVLCHIMSYHVT